MVRSHNPFIIDKCARALFSSARFVNEQVSNPRPHFGAGGRSADNAHFILAFFVVVHLVHAAPGRAGHVAGVAASIIKSTRSWSVIDNVIHAVIDTRLASISPWHVDADFALGITRVGAGALVDIGAQVLKRQEPVGTRALWHAVDNAAVVIASEQLQLAFVAHYFRSTTTAAWSDIRGRQVVLIVL